MLKATQRGIEHLGEEIQLTEEDHLTILEIIAESSSQSSPRKFQGKYVQDGQLKYTSEGYYISKRGRG